MVGGGVIFDSLINLDNGFRQRTQMLEIRMGSYKSKKFTRTRKRAMGLLVSRFLFCQ